MHWLIASMGTSPEVLTEALFALEQDGKTVSHATCVGTGDAFREAEARIFAENGALQRLRRALGKPESWLSREFGFHWETEPLKNCDNRNLAEAKAMDLAFSRAILHAQTHGDGSVVACISGGRKTMSSSLQQAMVLLARPGDWAFHVLLNMPEGIQEADVFRRRFAFPGDPDFPEFAEVRAEHFELPLVRLRGLASSRGIDLTDPALVLHCQRAVDEIPVAPSLLLDLGTLQLYLVLGGHQYQIKKLKTPQALMLGAWAVAGAPGLRRVDAKPALERVLANWRKLPKFFPTMFPDSPRIEDYIKDWTHPGDNMKNTFEMAVSRLKTTLTEGNPLLDPFAIRSLDPKGTANPVYGFEASVYENGLFKIHSGFRNLANDGVSMEAMEG